MVLNISVLFSIFVYEFVIGCFMIPSFFRIGRKNWFVEPNPDALLTDCGTWYKKQDQKSSDATSTRSDILQGQALFRGVKQLRRCLVMLNNFEQVH